MTGFRASVRGPRAAVSLAVAVGGEWDLGALFDQEVFGRSRGQTLIVHNRRLVGRPPASLPDQATVERMLREQGILEGSGDVPLAMEVVP